MKSKFRDVPLDELATLYEGLGDEGVKNLLQYFPRQTVADGDFWTVARLEALRNKMGEGNACAALAGGKIITVADAAPKPAITKPFHLYDKFGNVKPTGVLVGNVTTPDREGYHQDLPRYHDPKVVAERIMKYVQLTGFGEAVWPKNPAEEVGRTIRETTDWFNTTPGMRRAAKGGYLPFIIPAGASYDNLLLVMADAFGLAYKETYPNRVFYNNVRDGLLASKAGFASGSRWKAKEQMVGQKPIVGIYTPVSLFGYSYAAAREQEKHMPEGMLLTSALEGFAGAIPQMENVARGYNTPLLQFAANTFHSADRSLHFCAVSDDAYFDDSDNLVDACDDCSCGLSVLRQCQ